MSQGGGTVPVLVLKEGTGRSTGRDAQKNNIMAAKIVAEAVKSTLGPCGMDKMLVTSMGDVAITNDGATIMKELDIQHPAAKMLVEVAKAQDNEVGDGTTTAVNSWAFPPENRNFSKKYPFFPQKRNIWLFCAFPLTYWCDKYVRTG